MNVLFMQSGWLDLVSPMGWVCQEFSAPFSNATKSLTWCISLLATHAPLGCKPLRVTCSKLLVQAEWTGMVKHLPTLRADGQEEETICCSTTGERAQSFNQETGCGCPDIGNTGAKKLNAKYINPYKTLYHINEVSYRLDLLCVLYCNVPVPSLFFLSLHSNFM